MTQSNSARKWLETMHAGQSFFNEGRLNEARAHFAKATKIQPDQAVGWANLGICLGASGRPEEALVALSRALKLDASLAPCQHARGRALLALNRIDEAIEAIEASLALQPTPDSLNDLANMLRMKRRFAEAYTLYGKALSLAPDHLLSAVNQAICLVELGQYDSARTELDRLSDMPLSQEQRNEVEATRSTLDSFTRYDPHIADALATASIAPIEAALRSEVSDRLAVDLQIMSRIEAYAASARTLAPELGLKILAPLPSEWDEIEALFMVPVIETPDAFLAYASARDTLTAPNGDWIESLNLIEAIRAMRAMTIGPHDPIHAEACMRYWHALACKGLAGFLPGHFKITANRGSDSRIARARPGTVTGTTRALLGHVAASVPSGLPRALVLLIGILDIHPFPDGNGRVALAMMNRELERNGMMPALFTRETGFRGRLHQALNTARLQGGDLGPLAAAIIDGMALSQDFVLALRHA